MRGEYWETGNAGPLPLWTGDPKPAIPDTLYRLVMPLGLAGSGGRVGGTGGGDWSCSLTCKCRAGSDCCPIDGGVMEPVVGVVPWLASLEESVERSVLKLALDSLRKSLRLRKDGAMADVRRWPETCPQGFLSKRHQARRHGYFSRPEQRGCRTKWSHHPNSAVPKRVVGGSAARLADCCSLLVVQP